MEPLVSIKDMHKIYNPGENEVRALDGVSLEIHEGEFVAIIGHSGSGKSTLMNMIGCLDTPTSGSYFLHGKDVSRMTDNELSDVRNQELIYRGIDRKTRRAAAKQALIKVGLEKRMTHKPSEMSGGQQQRVAVARAIAASPPVILADEPTGNLDSKSTKEIMQILEGLHKSGRTVIIITHDNEIAEQVKRVIYIRDGRIEQDYLNEEKQGE